MGSLNEGPASKKRLCARVLPGGLQAGGQARWARINGWLHPWVMPPLTNRNPLCYSKRSQHPPASVCAILAHPGPPASLAMQGFSGRPQPQLFFKSTCFLRRQGRAP